MNERCRARRSANAESPPRPIVKVQKQRRKKLAFLPARRQGASDFSAGLRSWRNGGLLRSARWPPTIVTLTLYIHFRGLFYA